MLNKESFLSKSACLEQWTGIWTPGPSDCTGRDTQTMGELVGLGARGDEVAVPLVCT